VKSFKKALMIFRRDLRLFDNTALLYALENAQEVFCAFVFTKQQIESNPYRSDSALQFMLESLEDLQSQIREKGGQLLFFYDSPEDVVQKAIEETGVDLVVVNRDYTPYSVTRDEKMKKVCETRGVHFESCDDALLFPPEFLLKKNGDPYTVFTPFYKNALEKEVDRPKQEVVGSFSKGSIAGAKDSFTFETFLKKRRTQQKGGRKEALKILARLKEFIGYGTDKDFPIRDGSTHLAPHMKFTTVSPREVYFAVEKEQGEGSELLRALHWRDFFSSIAFYFPHVFSGAFHEKYDKLEWDGSEEKFTKWCEGKTGFPIVDAGMRELNETGFMNNRVRMIVASFLIKDLHINWRKGEQYFAQHLIDYDPAINNGSWQWVASTGCDAAPYFRIFNPWMQQVKFDPECEYIKKWVNELEDEGPKEIHAWFKQTAPTSYPLPMVDHKVEAKKTSELYKRC